jgi:diguanylate cyclase (GGDEF)-like protein/PAS domain S-box-containing protein
MDWHGRIDPRRSMRARVGLTFGVAALALATLVSVLVGRAAQQQLEREAGSAVAELAFQMADKLDRQMFERYKDVTLLSTLDVLRDPDVPAAQQRALLDQLKATYPWYAWIGLVDADGRVLAGTDGILEGADASKRDPYLHGRNGPWVGDVHDAILLAKLLPNPTGEVIRFVDVAAPVYRPDGALRGVLIAHPSWTWAREVQDSLIRAQQQADGVELWIVAADGTVLLQPRSVPGEYAALDLGSLAAARAGGSGYLIEAWPDDGAHLTGYAGSRGYLGYPGLGWTVLVRQPIEVAFARARELERQVIWIGVALGVAFALLGWALAGRLTTPLRALAGAMARFRHGEREVVVPAVTERDEVGALARVLDDLLRTVSEQERGLRAANEGLEQRVRERTAELRTLSLVAQRTEHAVIIADADGRAAWVNEAFTRMSGYAPDEVLGRRPDELLHGPDTDPDVAAHIAACIARGQGFAAEVLNYAKDGHAYWVAADVRPVRDDDGALTNFVAIERDVSDRRAREERLRHDALHDGLTGLPNRVLFHDRMAHAARRATRDASDGFAVLFVDLDGFKAVNDTLGHAAGDELLVQAARLLEANVRPGDTVARLGGDEFAILLEHVTAASSATRVADRILARLAEPILVAGREVRVSGSIGIALSGVGGIAFEDTLRGADAAMYRAKADGKGRYAVFDTVIDGPALVIGPRRSAPVRPARRAG